MTDAEAPERSFQPFYDSGALSAMKLAVDPKVGLITSAEFMMIREGEPPVFVCHAAPSTTEVLSGMGAANRGAACSAKPENAFIRACGEAIERYCSAFVDESSLVLKSTRELLQEGAA